MKRVKSACICQTLHFSQKDNFGLDHVAQKTREEVEQYKKNMDKNHTKYKIVEETEQSDGSIVIRIIKQYNASPVGDYLD